MLSTEMARVARRTALVILGALLAGCDDGNEPLTPSRLEVHAGDAQTGAVASPLAVEPAVRVLAANGQPVSGVRVAFEVVTGGGSVARTTANTDARGLASAGVWTLGTVLGAHALTASVSGVAPVTFSASAMAGAPTWLIMASGNSQRAVVGRAVPAAPTVLVRDAYDNPVANVPVSFTVAAGGGSVANTSAMTQPDGTASAGVWTLGGLAGQQTLSASASGITGPPLTFTATADPGLPNRLMVTVQPAPNAASSAALPVQPVIQVADTFGNAVAQQGVIVTANSSVGVLRNVQATTDATGSARFQALSITGAVGNYTLAFTTPNLHPAQSSAITLEPGAAFKLGIMAGTPPNVTSGVAFTTWPVIEVQDEANNRVSNATHTVVASLASGQGALTGDLTMVAVQGRATFNNLVYAGQSPFSMRFSSAGLQSVQTNDISVSANLSCTGPSVMTLDFTLGQSARFRADAGITPQCLQFDLTRNRDQQYLVMIENMPPTGAYNGALFPGAGSNANLLAVTVASSAVAGNVITAARPALQREPELPPGMSHAWDFGAGRIYEYTPPEPAGGAPRPQLVRGAQRIDINSTSAAPQIGDTIVVYLVGIPRLSIQDGNQRAVVRYLSNELIIAEDVRLGTLRRGNGALNTPLTMADMDTIARAYAAHPRVQADLLFAGRHNSATEVEQPARIIAVHTLMPADNVWGYTYSNTNVFAWDYWVSSNGSTRGIAQHALRNAHNLFMHEIAHMRHWGLLERANREDLRGNLWLVEGFARFSERLPIASYLLNNANPSRTSNATLGAYPEFTVRFREDVPSYLNTSSPMFDGYAASSYIFDYLADQVAMAGGNWRTAISNFLIHAGTEVDLNGAVNGLLPGLTFAQLFTRARLALYLDDIGTSGLPSWTQYHQYNLRASREPGSAASFDPRNAWQRVQPGLVFHEARLINPGAAFGYLIDGTAATSSARITFDFESPVNGVISVTRIR
ncbi:MAG: hypothetical protein ACRENP_09225 [Longimicrobiales bacterium]